MRPTEGLEEAYNYDAFQGLLIFTSSKDCIKCDQMKTTLTEVSDSMPETVKIVDLGQAAPDEVLTKYKLQMDMLPKIFLSHKGGKKEEYTGEMNKQSLMDALTELNKKNESAATEIPAENPTVPEDFRIQS